MNFATASLIARSHNLQLEQPPRSSPVRTVIGGIWIGPAFVAIDERDTEEQIHERIRRTRAVTGAPQPEPPTMSINKIREIAAEVGIVPEAITDAACRRPVIARLDSGFGTATFGESESAASVRQSIQNAFSLITRSKASLESLLVVRPVAAPPKVEPVVAPSVAAPPKVEPVVAPSLIEVKILENLVRYSVGYGRTVSLAADIGVSPETARRHLLRLEAAGFVGRVLVNKRPPASWIINAKGVEIALSKGAL